MHSRVENRFCTDRQHQRQAPEDEDDDRECQHVGDDQAHLRGTDLLAQELRRPPDHQPRQEHGQQNEHEHGVEAPTISSWTDLTEEDGDERSRPADRCVAVESGIGGTSRGPHGPDGHERGPSGTEPALLPLHVAAQVVAARHLGHARRQKLVAVSFRLHRDQGVAGEEDGHHHHDGAPLPPTADEAAEHESDRERQHDDQQQVEHVGEAVRVFEGVGAACAVEAATVGAEQLDDFHRCDRTAGDVLSPAGNRRSRAEAVDVLDRTLANEDEGGDHRDGHEDAHQASGEIGPEVPDRAGTAGDPTDDRQGNR